MINQINKKYFLLAVSGTKIGKSSDVDIAVRCPVCGDSNKNKNSTRLHLFHKNNKEKSRVKHYDKFADKIANEYNYEIFYKTAISSPDDEYVLVRKDKIQDFKMNFVTTKI